MEKPLRKNGIAKEEQRYLKKWERAEKHGWSSICKGKRNGLSGRSNNVGMEDKMAEDYVENRKHCYEIVCLPYT